MKRCLCIVLAAMFVIMISIPSLSFAKSKGQPALRANHRAGENLVKRTDRKSEVKVPKSKTKEKKNTEKLKTIPATKAQPADPTPGTPGAVKAIPAVPATPSKKQPVQTPGTP